MRWDPLLRLHLVYPGGGDDKQQTTTNVHYSPEEAAIRAYLMGEGGRVYAQNQGGTDWDAYNKAVADWEAETAGNVFNGPHGPVALGPKSPKPQQAQFNKPGAAPEYPGAKPIAPSASSVQANEMMKQFALGPGAGISNQATNALQFGLSDVLRPESNPALQSTIDTATRKVGQAYTDPGGVISQIRGNFMSGAPGGGSSREGIAMGVAGRGYLDTIGDVTGRIASEGYAQGLDHVARTQSMAPNLYNLATQPAVTLGAAGTQEDMWAQGQEQYQAERRGFALDAPWRSLQNYASIVHGMGAPGSTTSADSPGIQPVQRAGMAMGGATIGYQMGGGYGAAAGAAIGLMMSYM